MKNSKLLFVPSLLMLIFSSIGLLVYLLLFVALRAYLATTDFHNQFPNLAASKVYLAFIIIAIPVLLEFITSIIGIAAWRNTNLCMGIIILVLIIQVISIILNITAFANAIPNTNDKTTYMNNTPSYILGFILPILYLLGVLVNKKNLR